MAAADAAVGSANPVSKGKVVLGFIGKEEMRREVRGGVAWAMNIVAENFCRLSGGRSKAERDGEAADGMRLETEMIFELGFFGYVREEEMRRKGKEGGDWLGGGRDLRNFLNVGQQYWQWRSEQECRDGNQIVSVFVVERERMRK